MYTIYNKRLYKIGKYSEYDSLKINLKNTIQYKLTMDKHRNKIDYNYNLF